MHCFCDAVWLGYQWLYTNGVFPHLLCQDFKFLNVLILLKKKSHKRWLFAREALVSASNLSAPVTHTRAEVVWTGNTCFSLRQILPYTKHTVNSYTVVCCQWIHLKVSPFVSMPWRRWWKGAGRGITTLSRWWWLVVNITFRPLYPYERTSVPSR